MDLTAWLDVAIGLTLVYLGVSLFTTIINESIAQIRSMREKELHAALLKLIDDETIRQILAKQPALAPFLSAKPTKGAAYVDPKILGPLLAASLCPGAAANTPMNRISEAIAKLSPSALKTQLQSIALTAEGKTEQFIAAVGDWMDRSLIMMGESYKQRLQKMSFVVGLVITVVLNINTFTLTGHLYHDKELRNAIATYAVQMSEQISQETFEKCLSAAGEIHKDPVCQSLTGLTEVVHKRNESLGRLPVGWPDTSVQSEGEVLFWVKRCLGWLLTALAVSLGAPFWFDLLNKAVSIRHGVRPSK